MPKTKTKDYKRGSGNVFADLGVRDPEEALAKAELAHKITVLVRDRGLTQIQAAKLLGISRATLYEKLAAIKRLSA